MEPTLSGFAMSQQLRALRTRHGVQAELKPLPLLPALDGPVWVRGVASTASVDLDRSRFAPGSIKFSPTTAPKLLFKHDPGREVGTIHDIAYLANGELIIDATITDLEAARMAGAQGARGDAAALARGARRV